MKKIICFILNLTILFSVFVISKPITTEAKENTDSMSRYILTYLGIIDETDGVGITEPITRAEFSEYLCKALKLQMVTDKVYFKDVPQDFWGAGSVNALREVGIISNAVDGYFNPNTPITYEQICKMLVVATEYADISECEGEIMSSYVKTAKKCGIKTVPDDLKNVTFDEAIKMLVEGMFVVNPTLVGYGSEGAISQIKENGDTLFSLYHNIYMTSGQVHSLYGMSIGNVSVEENEAVINGEIYELDSKADLTDYFGQEIEFIYREDKNDIKTIICAVPANETPVEVSSDLIASFDAVAGKMEYYPDDASYRAKSISFNPKATVIYNGRIMEGRLSEKIDEFKSGARKGAIKFIKNRETNVYDLININSYEIFTVGTYDANEKILYDYYDAAKTIELGIFDQISIKDTNGLAAAMPVSFPASLQIAASENGEAIQIICCNEKKKISVKAIKSEREIKTEDAIYKIDESLYDRFTPVLKVGNTYTITLDSYGEIVYMEAEENSGLQVGWLRKVYVTDEVFDSKYFLLIYNHSENVSQRYELAKKVVIDGESYSDTNIKSLLLAFPGDIEMNLDNRFVKITPQLIRFSLNSDGKVKTIDTENVGASEDRRNSLYKLSEGDYYFSASHGWYGISIPWKTGITKTMQIPLLDADGYVDINGEKRQDDDSMYSNVYMPTDWYRYNIVAYKWSDESLVADMIVNQKLPSNDSNYTYVFDEISSEYTEDEEVKDVLHVFNNGTAQTYYIDSSCLDEARALKRGDIITFSTDFRGDTVVTITKMFDSVTLQFGNAGNFTDPDREWWTGAVPTETTVGGLGGWRTNGPQLAKGYASTMKGGMLGIAFTLSDARDGKWTMPVSSVPVLICDEEAPRGDEIYVGSMNDIKTYEIFGDDCSFVVYGASSGKVGYIVVYR